MARAVIRRDPLRPARARAARRSPSTSFTEVGDIALFVLAALALIPLAWLIGEATEHAAHHTGPGIGGFLNATFGNAPELIIALIAVNSGLTEVVRGSLTGSVDREPPARPRLLARLRRRRPARPRVELYLARRSSPSPSSSSSSRRSRAGRAIPTGARWPMRPSRSRSCSCSSTSPSPGTRCAATARSTSPTRRPSCEPGRCRCRSASSPRATVVTGVRRRDARAHARRRSPRRSG